MAALRNTKRENGGWLAGARPCRRVQKRNALSASHILSTLTTNMLSHLADQYRYTADVDDNLKCSVCTEPLVDPVMLAKCSHIFCSVCITSWINHEPGKTPQGIKYTTSVPTFTVCCPLCKAFSTDTRTPHAIILNQLDELPVQCNFCQVCLVKPFHIASAL